MVEVSIDMKAWEVTFNGYLDEEEIIDFVFANNATNAKKEVIVGGTVIDSQAYDKATSNGASYNDIKIKREPDLDGYEKVTDMEFGERLITKFGWCSQLGDKYFDKINFNKAEYEKAFKENYAPDYTVSCVVCGKAIHVEDRLWIIAKPKRYGYFCSFTCLAKELNHYKDVVNFVQDKSNEFVADKVVLHKLLHIY